jgi:hypothetical protein
MMELRGLSASFVSLGRVDSFESFDADDDARSFDAHRRPWLARPPTPRVALDAFTATDADDAIDADDVHAPIALTSAVARRRHPMSTRANECRAAVVAAWRHSR